MKWQSWLLSIVGSLVVSGIGALVTLEMQTGARAEATEVRVHMVEDRLDAHDTEIDRQRKAEALLERIDERVAELRRIVDRLESKLDSSRQRARR